MKLVKLHLGCGKRDLGNEWIHIDGQKYPHVEFTTPLDKLVFQDNCASEIYASHVLEYFDRQEVVAVLKEWHRVLIPGGILRLAVPDFGAMARLYIEKGMMIENFLGPIFGRIAYNGGITYHKTAYDFVSLYQTLKDVGFNPETYKHYDWRNFLPEGYDDQSRAYIPKMDFENGTLISLNVTIEK
jgi:predicted SAM-dependent methyltransferase